MNFWTFTLYIYMKSGNVITLYDIDSYEFTGNGNGVSEYKVKGVHNLVHITIDQIEGVKKKLTFRWNPLTWFRK